MNTNKISIYLILITLSFSCLSKNNDQQTTINKENRVDKELYNEICKLDSVYFNAYNTCDLETQEKMISEDLEFYHDRGGLMTSKKDLIIALKNNICGKVKRTLVEGSVEVYPIPNFGAVQIGLHKFYNNQEPNAIVSPSKFIVLWKKENDTWKMTRVISLH